MNQIEFLNVNKSFDEKILDDVTFSTGGGFHFLVGKNGAGKTTLIRCALGLEGLNSGEIRFNGDSFEKRRKDISVVFDKDKLYLGMSGYDNLRIFNANSRKDKATIENVLEALDLRNDLLKRKVKTYSFGQMHRLTVAIALIKKPKFIFLDEPTIGLDPISWGLIKDILVEYHKKYDLCALITGQDYEEMQKLCDSVTVLNKRRILYSGTVDELMEQYPYVIEFSSEIPDERSKSFLESYDLKSVDSDSGKYKLFAEADSYKSIYDKIKNIETFSNVSVRKMNLKEIFKRMVDEDV